MNYMTHRFISLFPLLLGLMPASCIIDSYRFEGVTRVNKWPFSQLVLKTRKGERKTHCGNPYSEQ